MPAAKLDIEFSKRTRGLARFDATFPQIIYAQLVAIGYGENESAWVAFYGFNKLVDNAKLERKVEQARRSDKIRALIEYFRKETISLSTQGSDAIDALISRKISEDGEMGAEATAAELLRMAQAMPDGKERADLMMKYADLKGFKKAGSEARADKRQVAFFLPAQCSTCPCYRYAMDNGSDSKPLHSSKV